MCSDNLFILKYSYNLNIMRIMEPGSLINSKITACITAIDKHIQNNMVVGVGSGSTMVFLVEYLKKKVLEDKLDIKCIPTSHQSKQLIIDAKLPLVDLESHPQIDVAIDGADEVDSDLVAIKGGGGCLLQEKIVASASKKFIIVADYTKDSKKLGQSYSKGIPIEVVPMAIRVVMDKIRNIIGPSGELEIREGTGKAGPLVTDNGNFILDWKFDKNTDYCWPSISDRIKLIPGVVETGIFYDMIHAVYYGQQEKGLVVERLSKSKNIFTNY